MTTTLEEFNRLGEGEAIAELVKCCGAIRWATRLASERPFDQIGTLLNSANSSWEQTEPMDWLEAFSHHPKIGEKKAEQSQTEQERLWSEQEQSNADKVGANIQSQLADLNREYEHRFGHIFIVCASGKTAEEMLRLLKVRITNDPETELKIAAEEQRKIMEIRLRKLFAEEGN